jgi:hypothetical protein
VGEGSGHRAVWRGLRDTVSGYWDNPEYLILDVKLEDGRTLMFWNHESE